MGDGGGPYQSVPESQIDLTFTIEKSQDKHFKYARNLRLLYTSKFCRKNPIVDILAMVYATRLEGRKLTFLQQDLSCVPTS